jgi:hypothetical protein
MMQLAENLHIRLIFLGIGRDLGVVVGLARLASFFLLLSQKKETKEKATLSRSTLRCSASWTAIETQPNKPHKTWLVAGFKQSIADDLHETCAVTSSWHVRQVPAPTSRPWRHRRG